MESAHHTHALYVFQHSIHQFSLCSQSPWGKLTGFLKQSGIDPKEQQHPNKEHKTDSPVKAHDCQRKNRSPDHSHNCSGNHCKRHTLQIGHCRSGCRSKTAQALCVEITHRHIFHAFTDVNTLFSAHSVVGVSFAIVGQIPAERGTSHTNRHNSQSRPCGGPGHVLSYQRPQHYQ